MHQDTTRSKAVPDPISVDVSRARRVFEITWAGGHKTSISLDDLRSMCDCALCRDEREKRETQAAAPRMLPVLGSVIRAAITSVNHVGRYALGVSWKDGHQSIFTYEYLFTFARPE
jgi:DUF971 family protein